MSRFLLILLCIIATFLMMPIAHLLVALLKEVKEPNLWIWGHLILGLLGCVVIWAGLKKQGLQASVLGFVGAHLIFLGFFELSFAWFAKLLNVPPLLDPESGKVVLSPALQVNEATFFILLPLLFLVYANKNVRCNMLVWLRKQFRADLGQITLPVSNRPIAQIVATETIFIIWSIYSLSLLTLDHRILGATHWLSMLIYIGLLVWPLYLNYRIMKFQQAGIIFRYAIPVSVLYWAWVEMFASMDMITELYLRPFEYPLFNITLIFAAVVSLVLVYRHQIQQVSPKYV